MKGLKAVFFCFWCVTEEQANEEPALAHDFPETASLYDEEQRGKEKHRLLASSFFRFVYFCLFLDNIHSKHSCNH